VLAVQPGCLHGAQEELAAVGVGASIGHGQHTCMAQRRAGREVRRCCRVMERHGEVVCMLALGNTNARGMGGGGGCTTAAPASVTREGALQSQSRSALHPPKRCVASAYTCRVWLLR
jgi:hypothetical protein